MTPEQIIEMAKQACAGIRGGLDSASLEELQRFAQLVRNETINETLNCYSPDDLASDWENKIERLKS